MGMILSLLIMLPFIFLCAWLIGSGFSARKLKIKSFEFLKFFIISLVGFGLIAFIELMTFVVPSDYQKINGIDIPLSKCMDGSKNLIPDNKKRKIFCICLADKVSSPEFREEFLSEIKRGDFDAIIKKFNENGRIKELNFESCITNAEGLKWTDRVEEQMIKKMKSDFKGTEFEALYDVDTYSKCLVKKFRNFPLSKVYDESFYETVDYEKMEADCLEKSKLSDL